MPDPRLDAYNTSLFDGIDLFKSTFYGISEVFLISDVLGSDLRCGSSVFGDAFFAEQQAAHTQAISAPAEAQANEQAERATQAIQESSPAETVAAVEAQTTEVAIVPTPAVEAPVADLPLAEVRRLIELDVCGELA